MRRRIEAQLREKQHRYWKDNVTTDLAFSLSEIVEKIREFTAWKDKCDFRGNTEILSFDTKKQVVKMCGREYGATGRIMKAIKILYKVNLQNEDDT